jgi:hypothetical protein
MKLIPLLKEIKIANPHKVKLRIPSYEFTSDSEDYFHSGILTDINIPVWVEIWDNGVEGNVVVIYITQFYNPDDEMMSIFNLHKDKESAEKDALKLKLYAQRYKHEISVDNGGVTVKIPLENVVIVN